MAEMAYCGPLGIPHSVFLGWDELDQDKAIAWLSFEKSKCNGCNTFPSEYLDSEGRMAYPPPYVVSSEICYGCVLIKEKNDEIGDRNEGISLRMTRNPLYEESHG